MSGICCCLRQIPTLHCMVLINKLKDTVFVTLFEMI